MWWPLGKIFRYVPQICYAEIPILYYHSIGDTPNASGFRVQVDDFEEQIKYLVSNYEVISFDELLTRYEKRDVKLLRNTALVTFDDGYLDNFEEMYPIVKKYNCSTMIYICTGFINKDVDFFEDGEKLRPMSWDQISEMYSSGLIEFGLHTDTHRRQHHLTRKESLDDIKKSKDILVERLGVEIYHYAPPNGDYNYDTFDILQELNVKTSVTTEISTFQSRNLLKLSRIMVSSDDNISIFKKRLNGYFNYLKIFHRLKRYIRDGIKRP